MANTFWHTANISIHALREEGDRPIVEPDQTEEFLSTPSARRATSRRTRPSAQISISIHALREEGDATVTQQPRGTSIFLSTPSARRATSCLLHSP